MKRKSYIPKGRILGKDWLELKPYETFSMSYDNFYLKTANQVRKVLEKYGVWFYGLGFEEDDLNIFSCVLVSYLEDYVNEIGKWTLYCQIPPGALSKS